jgi:4-carboxymuconolactone decarboxylase
MQENQKDTSAESDAFRRGLVVQEALFGPGFDKRRSFGLAERFKDWHRITIETLFGTVWSREAALSLRTRSLVTVVALVASGRDEQLRVHLRGALHVGWSPDELGEVLMHCAFYVGWPKAMSIFLILDEILKEGTNDDRG